jgi:hypothetical protein
LAEACTAAGRLDAAAVEIEQLTQLGIAQQDASLQANAARLGSELLRARGDRSGALQAARHALMLAEQGDDSSALIDALLVLAPTLREADARAEARVLIERALALLESRSGSDPRRAAAQLELTALLREAGARGAASAAADKALHLVRARWPNSHPLLADALSLRAAIAADGGDLQAAVAGEREAVQILEQSLGSDNMLTGGHRSALAFALRRAGNKPEALAMYRAAIDTFSRLGNADHPYAINALGNAALLLDELGDGDGAEAAARAALAASRRTLGSQSSGTASRLYTLSTLLRRHGKAKEALALAQAALVIDDALPDLPPATRIGGIRNAAQAHAAAGAHTESNALFERAIGICDSWADANAGLCVDVRIAFAQALQAAGESRRAISVGQSAVALSAGAGPLRAADKARAERALAELQKLH